MGTRARSPRPASTADVAPPATRASVPDRVGWRTWGVSVVVSGGLLAYLVGEIDPAAVWSAARGMTPRFLAAFLGLLLVGVAARAVRYWIILDRRVPLPRLGGIVLVRNFSVDLLPARLGELVYVYLVTTRAGRPVEEGLASLALAVAFDLVALAPLLLLAVIVVGGGGVLSPGWLVAAAVFLGGAAFAAARLAAPVARRVATRLASPDAATMAGRLAALVIRTADAVDTAWARGIALPVLAVSMVVRLAKFGSYFFLVLAIMGALDGEGVDLGFFRVFLGVVSAELAAALPIPTVASFGTFEAAWTVSFTQLGFPRETAIISGVLAHAVSQLVEYTLGAIALACLMRPGAARTTPRDVETARGAGERTTR